MKRTLLCLLLAACGSTTEQTVSAQVDEAPEEPSDALRSSLVRRLEATVLDNYGHLNLNNADAFVGGLARDRAIILLGPTDREFYDAPARARMQVPKLGVARNADIVSKNLHVELSQSGEIGWVFDEISYRALHQERIASIPIRRTAVYVFQNGEWLLALEHRSYPTEIATLEKYVAASQVAFLKPARVPPNAPLTPEAVAVLRAFQEAPDGDVMRALSATSESLLLLPGWDGEYKGARIRSAPLVRNLLGAGGKIIDRGCHIEIAPSGSTAYGYCVLGLKQGAVELGLRASYVLERRRESNFRIVQAHIGAPLLPAQLQSLAFGE